MEKGQKARTMLARGNGALAKAAQLEALVRDGEDARDHLIRAKVRYGTGLEEELPGPVRPWFSLSPNPAQGRVRLLTGNRRPEAYSVSDASGRSVAAGTSQEIDLSGLGRGVYLVSVRTDRGTSSAKLVKE